MPEQVRRGGCNQCGEAALVQKGWVRHGMSARERWMCRRCWRSLKRANMVITPQDAGKRIKKQQRYAETLAAYDPFAESDRRRRQARQEAGEARIAQERAEYLRQQRLNRQQSAVNAGTMYWSAATTSNDIEMREVSEPNPWEPAPWEMGDEDEVNSDG